MSQPLRLSFVVPAYKVAGVIGTALHSLYDTCTPLPDNWELEVVVVEDGSPDRAALLETLTAFPQVRLVTHEQNRGITAARNTGLKATTGDIVTILDADDELVPGWSQVMVEILKEWPAEANLCFSACLDLDGRVTSSDPDYTGPFTFEDMLCERHVGEYLPHFRGPFIRERSLIDLGTRRDCNSLYYLTFLQEGSGWMTAKILRLYHCRVGAEMRKWTSQDFAWQLARCYEAMFEKFGAEYRAKAPRIYRSKLLRYAIYLKLAKKPGAWKAWTQGAHWSCLKETFGAFLMLIFGSGFTAWLVEKAKKLGVIKRYG